MEDNKTHVNREDYNEFIESEEQNAESTDAVDNGFEKVDLNYSPADAARTFLQSVFPFTKPGRQRFYGNIAFIAAAGFMSIPGIIAILSWFMPRKTFLSYISTQTYSFLNAAAIAAAVVFAYILLGRIIDCIVNKKRFFPNKSPIPRKRFKTFILNNKVRCLLAAVLVLLALACFFGLNTEKAIAELKPEASILDKVSAVLSNNSFTNQTDGLYIWIFIAMGAAIVSLIKDRKQMRILLIIFCASAVCTCVTMYIQYVVYYKELPMNNLSDFIKLWSTDFSAIIPDAEKIRHMRGIFSNSNHYGYFLTLSSLAAAGLYITGEKWWQRILSALGFSVMIFALVLNDTLGTQLAVVTTVVLLPVIFIKSKRPIYRRFMPIVFMVFVMALMTAFPKTPLGSNVVRNSANEFIGIINHVVGKSASAESADIQTESEDGQAEIKTTQTESEDAQNESAVVQADNTDGETSQSEENRWWLKNQDLGTSRLGLWQYGIHLLAQRPVLGWGIYSTKDLFENESGLANPASRVHNEYLQMAIDGGLIAAITYIAALIIVVIYFIRGMIKGTLDNTQRILFGMFLAYSISALMGIWAYYTACFNLIWLALLISTFEGSIQQYPKKEPVVQLDRSEEEEAVDSRQ